MRSGGTAENLRFDDYYGDGDGDGGDGGDGDFLYLLCTMVA